MKKIIASLSFMSCILLEPSAHAQLVSLNFESGTATSNQFTNNFRLIGSASAFAGTVAQTDPADAGEPNNDYVFQAATTPGVVNYLYDTTPTNTSDANQTFAGNLTITMDISAVQADSSFGIHLIDTSNFNNNLLAVFNLDRSSAPTTTDRIRFFKDGGIATGAAGTLITGGDLSGLSGLNVSPEATPVFGTMTVNYAPTTGIFSLSLGTLSHSVTVDVADRITNPAIAFRLGDSSTTAGSAKIDNFTVVPEPTTFAMLLGGFGLLLGFQRRRR